MFAPTMQGNSLSCDMRDAFASNDFTDMTIVCDKREFHCHKFLLAARWSTTWYLEAPILGMNSNQFCLSLEKNILFYPALFPDPRCLLQCSATSSWRSRTAELTWRRSTERPWSFSFLISTLARFKIYLFWRNLTYIWSQVKTSVNLQLIDFPRLLTSRMSLWWSFSRQLTGDKGILCQNKTLLQTHLGRNGVG